MTRRLGIYEGSQRGPFEKENCAQQGYDSLDRLSRKNQRSGKFNDCFIIDQFIELI